VQVGEVALEVVSLGREGGSPLVFLHDIDYLNGVNYPFLQELAASRRVLAPSHPGFGGSSLPEDLDTVEDLAFVYLDYLRQLHAPVDLIGAGFGGWIAAEVAVRCTHQLRSLTLIDALGIKVGDRTTVDIQDLFVLSPEALIKLCWHDPALGERLMPLATPGKGFDEDTLTQLLTSRRTAALVGWNPFMHNPKLRRRLQRVDVPALVIWGSSDGLVSPAYGRAYAAAIPNAHFAEIQQAGHYPYLERPREFVTALEAFLGTQL
jgi:pimeloyl-ACP methyl ester carboxylesterase